KKEDNWRISMPSAPEGAKWTPAPRMIDDLHYRRDRTGFIEQGTPQLFLVTADGGTPRQLTSGEFGVSELGTGLNYDWPPDRKVTEGTQMLSLASIARDFTAVGTLSDPDEPGDVVRYSLRKPQPITRLTSVNADVLARIRLARVEEVWYRSTGGARIQGWIVKP